MSTLKDTLLLLNAEALYKCSWGWHVHDACPGALISLGGSRALAACGQPTDSGREMLPLEAFRSIFGEFGYFTMTKTLITWNCGSNNMSRRGRRDPTCNYHIQKRLQIYTEVGLKIVKLCLKPFPPSTVFKFCVGWIPHFWRRHGKPSPEPLEMDL